MPVNQMTTEAVIGKRYVLGDLLGAGGMGSVYRAKDRLTGRNVALKTVTVAANQLVFASLSQHDDFQLALAQEFRTLASLRHPNIIGVLDYGFGHQGQPYFTMDLLEQPQTILAAGQNLGQVEQVDLLTQMLQALVYLHRRGILHRDLKPSNVLVINGKVKVLDFGLSVSIGQKTELESDLAGTLGYMAPEVLLEGVASVAADLYALGVIAYEIFAGRHPFDLTNISTLIHQMMESELDLTNLIDASLPAEVTNIIVRLLDKEPRQRYANANEVIIELNKAIGRRAPQETAEIRESFIQAASFIGRDQETGQLLHLLQEATQGTGDILLVGGESGVGKSRLLEEFRTRIMVRGIPVLLGQCVSEGRRPYQVWRSLLRGLVLFQELNDFEAMVLKAIVPDIGELIGKETTDAPEVEPQAAHDRLLAVLENIFSRQTQPIVFILEDLQWANAESLAVLRQLPGVIRKSSIFVIGSYRDDEYPDLPNRIPEAQVMRLQRLEARDIAHLSASMLGSVGKQTQLVELLQRETEGNVFFLVEVVRALAEEAGQLEQISSKHLPKRVFAGGINTIIQRRLERIPQEGRPLLQLAATMGRELDEKVLRRLNAHIDYETWLTQCANVAVLEAQEDRWRFAHDKLRERLLLDLPPARQRELHRTVAEAIEQTYPDDPNQVAALAYHWDQADVRSKAIEYLEKAGEQALNSSAYDQAIALISRAMALDTDGQAAQDPLRYAHRSRLLGEAYYNIGQLVDASRHLEEALQHLNMPVPAQNVRVALALVGQIATQFMHRVWSGRFPGRSRPLSHLLEGVEIVRMLTSVQFIGGDFLRWAYVTVRWLNMAEVERPAPDINHALSFVYAIMTTVAGTIPIHRAAGQYQQLALKNVDMADENNQATVWNYVAIYTLGTGQWEFTETLLSKARHIYEELGHPRRWEELMIFSAFLDYYRGDFPAAYQSWEGHYPSSLRRNDTQMQYPSLIGRAQCILRTNPADDLNEVQSHLDSIAAFMFVEGRQTVVIERANYYAVLAALRLRQGEYQAAWEAGEKTLEFAKKLFSEAKVLVQEIYDRLAEVYLMLWSDHQESPEAGVLSPDQLGEVPKLARQACKLLRSYAKVITFTQSRAWLWQGWYEWLADKPDQAHKSWQKSLELAKEFQMPYDQGRAHYAIGYHLDVSAPERVEHLRRADEIFKQHNIRDTLIQADDLLKPA